MIYQLERIHRKIESEQLRSRSLSRNHLLREDAALFQQFVKTQDDGPKK